MFLVKAYIDYNNDIIIIEIHIQKLNRYLFNVYKILHGNIINRFK